VSAYWSSKGACVYDVSDPTNPTLVDAHASISNGDVTAAVSRSTAAFDQHVQSVGAARALTLQPRPPSELPLRPFY
jgi:hypothetical protein